MAISKLLGIFKPIERGNRTFWHWLLHFFWKNDPLVAPLDPRSLRRVLFLRYDAIGDMITTLPAIRMLKELNPEIEIDVLASPKNAIVVRHDPHISNVLLLRDRVDHFIADILTARRRDYDLIFCCIFAKATKIGIIANWIGPRAIKSTLWRGEKYRRFFNVQSRRAAEQHSMWDKMLYILPDTIDFDFRAEDARPYIAVDEASRSAAREAIERIGVGTEPFVAINLTTVRERNRWSEEGFTALVRGILARYSELRIVILWMAEDRALAERLGGLDPRVAIYPATRNVLEIVAVVGMSSAVFSVDTGVVHMGSATGRPTMAVYVAGTRAINEWRPWRVPYRAVESAYRGHPVRNIPYARVVREFIGLLDEVV